MTDVIKYDNITDTTSCYLDGRYFNRVFRNYPGLLQEPLNINIYYKNNELRYRTSMLQNNINTKYPGFLRVIINTPESRHSNLLILDYTNKYIFRFDPLGVTEPYYELVNQIITDYLQPYMDFDIVNLNDEVYDQKNKSCEINGIKSGFCVAYVIKYGYDYLNNMSSDMKNILKFAHKIEMMYGPLPELGKDVEYGFLDDNKSKNTALGFLGGGLAGGIITGSPAGFLVGGLAGGLAGNVLTKD